jgi:hypothetical protein
LNAPSSQSALPRRPESYFSRPRTRSSTSGWRSACQVALQELGGSEFKDRRLDRIDRGQHPCDRARPGIGILWQQAGMARGDVEDDRSCLEQGEITFLIGRNLTERMKRQMRGFLPRAKRNEANRVRLAHFFKRPANARIACQPSAAIG